MSRSRGRPNEFLQFVLGGLLAIATVLLAFLPLIALHI